MKDMLPKGLSSFLKNPDMQKLACVVVAILIAVVILIYFNVIEGMVSDLADSVGAESEKKDKNNNLMIDAKELVKKITGMAS